MSDKYEFDLAGFEQGLEESLQHSHEAFSGQYAAELNELAGLSRTEIDSITADTSDLATYDALITVVKEASRKNASIALLKKRIEILGSVAVEIASKTPSLAAILR